MYEKKVRNNSKRMNFKEKASSFYFPTLSVDFLSLCLKQNKRIYVHPDRRK